MLVAYVGEGIRRPTFLEHLCWERIVSGEGGRAGRGERGGGGVKVRFLEARPSQCKIVDEEV